MQSTASGSAVVSEGGGGGGVGRVRGVDKAGFLSIRRCFFFSLVAFRILRRLLIVGIVC